MILAIHLTAANGHPYSIDALCVEGDLNPNRVTALVRPQDWTVPEGLPRSHRECCKWGIPLKAVLGVVLRMAECADTFVAHGMTETDVRILAWCAADKALQSAIEAWIRPGPVRVDTALCLPGLPTPTDAAEVLRVYRIALETGAVAA